MFPPVESQVIFLSKETPIVSVGLRTAEVNGSSQEDQFFSPHRLGSPLIHAKTEYFSILIFTSMAFVKDANGISFKNRLKDI